MRVKDLIDIIFEHYYKQIGSITENNYYLLKKLRKKDLVLFATSLTKKIP